MKKNILAILLGMAAVFGVAVALATGAGDSPFNEPGTADMVVLGEEDLAERAEILRNMYRRITPPDLPLVQDVGTWPAAREEFGANWASAAVEREYGTWVVPVEVTQDSGTTVVKDGIGSVMWQGTTDFSSPESADVVLTGGLVAEEDWATYEGVRDAVEAMSAESTRTDLPGWTRTAPTNGLRFTAHEWTTNDSFRMELAYEIDTNVDIFAYAVAHTSAWVVATWTNDENVAITDTNLVWYPAGPSFNGKESDWEQCGTVAIDNGVAEFEDSGFPAPLGRVRFYAASVAQDLDGDGLNDGVEVFVKHTDPSNSDSDGDGVMDGSDPYPDTSNVWWVVTTTNELRYWAFVGDQPSWPSTPIQRWQTNVVGAFATNAHIVEDVRIDGYVDDIIDIDTVVLNTNPGPKRFESLSITNLCQYLDCGQMVLTLYDCPSVGHSGPNEVRLGDTNNEPFRVMWDWRIPVEMRMEPIWTSAELPLDNSSGVILGSNAWFHVDILPEGIVPEEKIVWTSLSNKLEFVTTNCGSRVQVRGDALGEDALCVEVEGAEGDFGLPPFHVRVMPLTVVTAKVGVVVSTNGEWAVHADEIAGEIEEANFVLLQIGKQIIQSGGIQQIPDEGDFFDVNLGSNAVHALRAKLSQPGGMEIYFVNSIVNTNGGHPAGVNHDNGMLICAAGTGRTLAHETFHACGANDIYDFHEGTDLKARGDIKEEWMPDDWGRYSVGETPVCDISVFVRRLLMYGYSTANSMVPKGDVPSGPVYGLGNFGYLVGWTNDLWLGVGLQGLLHAPMHN